MINSAKQRQAAIGDTLPVPDGMIDAADRAQLTDVYSQFGTSAAISEVRHMARYIHKGNSIDYTPAQDVAAGEVVVIGDLIGVAKIPIAANVLGALATTGVFDFPKAAGAGSGINAGTRLYWDAGNAVVATTAGEGSVNKQLGYATATAADAANLVRVIVSRA